LTSKIINMAEKLKDAEDRMLESMFAVEHIADDGFSQRIVTQIRRRIWVRRLALPVGMLVGGIVAFKPAMQLVSVSSTLLSVVPRELLEVPASVLPQVEGATFGMPLMSTIVLSAMVVVAAILGTRLLNE
jgi:hypothetical protein